MSRADPLFQLRLPEEIKRRVKISAERNRRSITGEIVTILDSALKGQAATGQTVQAHPAATDHEPALQGGPVTHGL